MAKKLSKVSRNGNIQKTAGFASLMYSFLKDSPLANDTNIIPITQRLKQPCLDLNEYVNTQKALTLLGDLDNQRDEATRSFYYFMLGQSHNPDSAIANAAKKFLDLFAEHGLSILQESYNQQSSFTENLIEKSSQQEYIDALTLLIGGEALLNNLINQHNQFMSQQIMAGHDNGNNHPKLKGTELKREILICLNDMLVNFLRYAVLAHGDTYTETANTVAELIKKFNIEVKLGHQPEEEPQTEEPVEGEA